MLTASKISLHAWAKAQRQRAPRRPIPAMTDPYLLLDQTTA
jgi:hypothetical protein